ncbi:MAG: GNAT family N-acetyltransferase [Anaerolineales bacterium]|nr:GNAT family N-acetyltransferase [Anaerolineales bacterium]
MSRKKDHGQVIYLSRDHLEGAIQLLSSAFSDDPLMHFLFNNRSPTFHQDLRELFRFTCEVRLELDWPILGCIADDGLVGVACVTEPEEVEWPESLGRTYRELVNSIGPEATERLERYSDLTDSYRPEMPHYYLAVLGVHPNAHGRGYGGLLLQEVGALSEGHPTSIGVGVDTENPENLSFYERFGYSLVAKTQLQDMDLWSMFRPNS